MDVDTDVEALAARQHGLFTHRQARDAGASEKAVQHRQHTGRWIRHRSGVYRLVGAPVTDRLELLAAVLAVPGAVASHGSAAAIIGLPGFEVLPAQLTAVTQTRPRSGVAIRRTAVLEPRHRTTSDGIPCTSVARTLRDLCGVVRTGRAERALDNALARRLVTIDALVQVRDDLAAPGRAGSATFRRLLAARDLTHVPPESELEARFLDLVRRDGLPEPARQVDLGDLDGWIGRVDFVFREQHLVVEVDGRLAHSGLLARSADAARDRRLRKAGWRVARFDWADVTRSPLRVLATVRAALAAPDRRSG